MSETSPEVVATAEEVERVRRGLHDGGTCDLNWDGSCDGRCRALADVWRWGIAHPSESDDSGTAS